MKRPLLLAAFMMVFPFACVALLEGASLPGCPARETARAGEKWAFLVYQVGPNRTVDSVEVPYASDPVHQEKVTKEAREGGVLTTMPGSFRTFRFEPPAGMQSFELDQNRLRQALSGLSGPLGSEPISADLAVRIELSADGQITGWNEIFSTRPGVTPRLRERSEAFLTASGLREGSAPRVIALFFTVREGRVVSASSSSYLLIC